MVAWWPVISSCHNSVSPFPCCKTHSLFHCINIHQLDCSLAWEPLSLWVPWLIFISHAPCLPYLSPFFPHSLLYSLNEMCALELSPWWGSRSPRKDLFSLPVKSLTERLRLASRVKDGRAVGWEGTSSLFSLACPPKTAPETHIIE